MNYENLNNREYISEPYNKNKPLISEAEAKKLKEKWVYRKMFDSLSNEANNWALPFAPEEDETLDRFLRIIEDNRN